MKITIRNIKLLVLRMLQKDCDHLDGEAVKADMLQGDVKNEQVKWCEICGAFGFGSSSLSTLRKPRPDYYYE